MKTVASTEAPRRSERLLVQPSSILLMVVGAIAVGLSGAPLSAQVCSVPGDHASIQFAVDDQACTTINLADQVYAESVLVYRSLSMVGPAGVAEIAGLVEVNGGGTAVDFTNIKVDNGCSPGAFVTSGGGQAETGSLEVVASNGGPCPPVISTFIFSDGFESSDTLAWTGTVP